METWGTGRARQVKRSTAGPTETVVFVSDLHHPYEEAAAVSSTLKLIRKLDPDRVVLNGDLADFFALSRFNTGLERVDSLQEEIDGVNRFRESVRKAAPNATLDETEGNHDNRIKSYVAQNARVLVSLRALEPARLFKYAEYEINPHPGCGFLLRRDFLVKHGTVVRGEAGASAKAEFALAGISGISGHTHRLATYRKSGYAPRFWTEQGCLCRLDPDYIKGGVPNWQQGIAVGFFSTRTANYHVSEVPFIDGQLRFGGQCF